MSDQAVFIYSEKILNYNFHSNHPFNQKRIRITMDLLQTIGALKPDQIAAPKIAQDHELLLAHDSLYIEAVKKAGSGLIDPLEAENFGLGTEDTPMFPRMHEAAAFAVGGTLTAVKYVMENEYRHALHLGGGLHHSMPGKASGFCIYNDCSVAIKYIREKYDAKVLYIDTDAHHGDGVQWSFYDDPKVCTLSIHETGRYLFPGTGGIHERGHGLGYGYSFNIPLDAFTEDESWLYAYKETVTKVADYFQPDVIFTQNGADAHVYDPLTHLSSTMKIYREIPKLAHKIAHQYSKGRWIAVGGGGYDIFRVVPRAWALLWLEMTDQSEKGFGSLPENWLNKWQSKSPVQLPKNWDDLSSVYPAIPRKKEIEEKNRITVENALRVISS